MSTDQFIAQGGCSRFEAPGSASDRYHDRLEDRITAEMRRADRELEEPASDEDGERFDGQG